MIASVDTIQKTIKKYSQKLRDDYSVSRIGIFGSTARGENTSASDIDMIVDFSKTPGLFQFVELENYLGKVLKKKVDLVTRRAIKPTIKNQVLRDTIYV